MTNTMMVVVMMALAAAVCGCATAPTSGSSAAVPAGFTSHEIGAAGQRLGYVVYVPRDYDPARPMPLVLFLHGMGECGTDGWKHVGHSLGLAVMRDPSRWPFVIVMPQKPVSGRQWEEYDASVMAALDEVERRLNIDRGREYLTGLSQGGHGTWAMAAAHPRRFAAIAPVAGYGDPKALAPALRTMPVWAFHGETDRTVPPSQTTEIAAAIPRSPDFESVKVTIYPGMGHTNATWDKVYGDRALPAWFLSHQRGPDR